MMEPFMKLDEVIPLEEFAAMVGSRPATLLANARKGKLGGVVRVGAGKYVVVISEFVDSAKYLGKEDE
jgi:hypothetical protein